ncbi:MAG: NAD(P)-binding domain-containing protein [Bacteroidota bacterium]|nr:NAD(P)-binding domain-containing protein [Bacteroidota bacterium]
MKHEFKITNSDIIKFYNNYEVLIIRSTRKIDKNFLESSTFKVIATCSKGVDHIELQYAYEKGIKILNANEGNHISAAEHTIALILAIFKKIILSDNLVRENKFNFYNYERNELFGKSIGIIGFGKVGSYVGNLCKSFGMKVYANDIDKNVRQKNKKFVFKSINFILKNCDIVSLHIPMNKNNFNFVSKEKLKLLNKDSVLINTSRGDIIEEKSLLRMLKEKKIKYAGLDVYSNEPNIDKGFAAVENTVLTNHIAGKTKESRRRISEHIFSQLMNFYR